MPCCKLNTDYFNLIPGTVKAYKTGLKNKKYLCGCLCKHILFYKNNKYNE